MSKTAHPHLGEISSTRKLLAAGLSPKQVAATTGQTVEQVLAHKGRRATPKVYGKITDTMEARLRDDEKRAQALGVNLTYRDIERSGRWG